MNLELHKADIRFPAVRLDNITESVRAEMLKLRPQFTGKTFIAVGVGSRGIANIALIVREVVQALTSWGCSPFIVPAMGSHGGATAQGQADVLASYGVTTEAMGCAIRSSMEVVELPASLPFPLYMDAHAAAADGIVIINRIKLHTDFHGRYESGLVKMAVIGLGKERCAHTIHCHGTHGLRALVPQAAKEIFASGRVVAGIAIVENAYDETAVIEGIVGNEIMEREPALLEVARQNMPSLPVEDIDVLIVDELGKNISGTGVDTNIVGRIRISSEPEPASPRIRAIMLDDLTKETHGNATGMGLADVVTRKLFSKIDWEVTYRNIVTSGFPERGKLPVVQETAREAYAFALRVAGAIPPKKLRVVRIKNTLHVSTCYVSEGVAQELKSREDVVVCAEAREMFDSNGKLVPFGAHE